MGEHEGWAEPSGLLPNGLLPNEVANVTRVLDAERWSKAEERTAELIARIQPNQPSEERRNAVANYVQHLIMKCFSCQVFTFGSVPLKTYLPDGDIDLTAFGSNENLKDTWANEVRYMLESEEKSGNAEFRVKEVQYIQAEVKIIKCLVEDIVVDISFNQVGGLCTLCFLEEIDHLINQNHLFKRSIILIKAWCYYESRILGAHHGLISTYALETLVLYIFHVFNNSFAGPLEVLFRFLEFFSNFDWDNFCVSLWGPVPISSLPDMTAFPPRKDGGELLLNKPFLDALSVVYAVKPSGQENQAQPFVSKHFNVIDPLRTNNNLGRSVSKGNFFRIRSAFAFGAKKLARLLDCPKEDLIAEVNQFFLNTWERHGSGHRPDAPYPNLQHLRPLKTVPVEGSNSSRSTGSIKNSRNAGLQDGHEHVTETGHDLEDPSSDVDFSISQHSQDIYRMNNPSTLFRNQGQKNNGVQVNSSVYGQFERNTSLSGSVQSDKNQKILRPQHSVNDQERHGRFHFARTRSSPELTEASVEVLSGGRRNGVVETTKAQNTSARLDSSRRIRNLVTEATGNHSMRSSLDDPTSIRHIPSHQSFEAASDGNSVSNSYNDDFNFSSIGEELASVSEALEMQQEEQDLVNMIASSKLHNLNGQVPLPMHLTSHHLPLTLSPLLASMGYVQRNLAGMVPPNLSLMGPSWGSNMQFPQGFFSSPVSQYYHPAGLSSNHDDMVESVSESSGMTGLNTEDGDQDSWKDDAGSARGFSPENRASQMLHFDGKQRSAPSGSNFSSSSRRSVSGAGSRGQHKFTREYRGPVREDYIDAFQNQASRVNDIDSNARNANVKFSPVSHSSRNKPAFESSRDGSASRVSRTARDKWGRKPFSSSGLPSHYGKARSGWQVEGSSDHDSVEVEDDSRDSISLSTMGTDMSERIAGSASLTSSHVSNHQLPGYETAHISGPDSMIPVAPVLVGTRQRTVDNSGLVPMTFFPTGPPVPFLMLPVYNFTSDTGNSDGVARQIDNDERADNRQTSLPDQNFDSPRNLDQSEASLSSTASEGAAFEPLEEKSDILNSDFASHLQNLVYGRFCQDAHFHGPVIYPSPAAVPPVYLQGHFPLDGPGRPLSPNVNFTQVMGYGPRLVPMMPIQPVPDRTSGVFQRYGDEAPRYRGGTGTYLPNPKVSFRDRQSSSRNRGNYGYDRSDHGDREGSWINSKTRAAGRSHVRNQADRPTSWPDQLAASEHHANRQWESQRHEPVASYLVPNNSFVPTKSPHGSTNMTYALHSPPVAGSDGVNPARPTIPPVFMVYPHDHNVGYDSSTEPLEFGTLGPMHPSGTNEVPRPNDGNPASGLYEHSHGTYFGGSPRSSPEHPSSPRLHGRES